jgi:hypothetical protein
MGTNESYVQYLEAQVARWFSKDNEHLTVYYANDGNAYPVTRTEQDQCLECAYGYIRVYRNTLFNGIRIPGFGDFCRTLIAFVLFWPCVMMVVSELPFPLNFSGLAAFFIVGFQYLEPNDDPRRTCLRQIKALKAEFEKRITHRKPVSSPPKRENSFKYFNWMAFGVLGLIAMFGSTIVHGLGVDERTLIIMMLLLLFVFLGSRFLFGKLNAANIRQTGKWFRWSRKL